MWELWFAIVVVALTAFAVQKYLKRQETKKTAFLSTELGVPDTFIWDDKLIEKVVDIYFDEVEKVESDYCKENKIGPSEELPAKWMSMCAPPQKKSY